MAPEASKLAPRSASLTPLAQSTRATPGGQSGQRTNGQSANCAVAVTLETIDVAGKPNSGARLCVGDAASLGGGGRGRNHALSALQARVASQYALPRVPESASPFAPRA